MLTAVAAFAAGSYSSTLLLLVIGIVVGSRAATGKLFILQQLLQPNANCEPKQEMKAGRGLVRCGVVSGVGKCKRNKRT